MSLATQITTLRIGEEITVWGSRTRESSDRSLTTPATTVIDAPVLTRSVSFEVALFRVLPQGGETRKPRPQAWGQGQTTAESPNGARLVDSCEVVFPSHAPLGNAVKHFLVAEFARIQTFDAAV